MKVFNTIRSFITYITLYVALFITITGNDIQCKSVWLILISVLFSGISAYWICEKLNGRNK